MPTKYPGNIISLGGPESYSNSFSGSGQYLSAAYNSAFTFAGDFTVEGWFYPTHSATGQFVWFGIGGDTDGLVLTVDNGNTYGYFGGTGNVLSGVAVKFGAWQHVAVVRSGTGSNNITLYINGISKATYTSNTTCNASSGVGIGYAVAGTSFTKFSGSISNFRVVKGTAVYTSNFVPPTGPLQNISGTSLLTCQSSTIVDNSSNAFTITNTGGVSVSSYTPLQGYNVNNLNPALGSATPGVWSISQAMQAVQTRSWPMYDPYYNNVVLNLHGNGTNGAQNNTFLDSSSNNFTITRNGDTTQGSFSPYSQNYSNYLNGSTDCLTFPDSASYVIAGDFTVEAWIFPTTSGSEYAVFCQWPGAVATNCAFILSMSSTTTVNFTYGSGASNVNVTGTTQKCIINSWNHIAATRSGSTIRLFVNGIMDATTATISGAFNDSTGVLTVGRKNASDGGYFPGYLSNCRFVNGTALYTGNFLPSTAPLTPVTNTVLLTCQSNRFVDNSSLSASATVVGTPSVQRFQPFLQNLPYESSRLGGSGYWDGTTDWLTVGTAANWAFMSNTTAKWTVEFWVYNLTTGSYTTLLDTGNSTTAGIGITIAKSSSEYITLQTYYGSAGNYIVNGTSSATLKPNAWNHVFISYDQTLANTNAVFYINGVAAGTANKTANTPSSSNPTNTLAIGCYGAGGGNFFPGYISSLRISNAVLSPPSGVPTAPYTSDANTYFLCNFTNGAVFDNAAMNDLQTVGNAQISTTQSKYGGASMYFDGTGDWLATKLNAPLILNSDFTVEAWVYPTTISGSSRTVYFLENGANGATFYVSSSGILSLDVAGVANYTLGSTAVTTNAWQHIAFVRSGTTLTGYINGVSSGTATVSASLGSSGAALVGANSNVGGAPFFGYIDDLRVTKGVARYTGNFTPPTSQLQDQ